MRIFKYSSTIALTVGIWMISSFVFALFHGEQVALLCASFTSPTCIRASLLLKPKINKRYADFNGTTLLIYFIDNASGGPKQDESLELLMEAGADPNLADSEGWSPLMVAAANGNLNLVEGLLRNGAQINRRARSSSTLDGMTALMAAAHHGHQEIVEYLLAQGAKTEIKSSKGLDAATIAALEGNEQVVELFQKHGVHFDSETIQSAKVEETEPPQELERAPASHRRVSRSRRPEE